MGEQAAEVNHLPTARDHREQLWIPLRHQLQSLTKHDEFTLNHRVNQSQLAIINLINISCWLLHGNCSLLNVTQTGVVITLDRSIADWLRCFVFFGIAYGIGHHKIDVPDQIHAQLIQECEVTLVEDCRIKRLQLHRKSMSLSPGLS